jgi:HSP20 family protein
MNKMFEDVLSRSTTPGPNAAGPSGWKPHVDLFEDRERYVLRADLPGVLPGDVEVNVEDGNLIVRGERRPDDQVAQDSYLRIERPSGTFATQVALPESVDPQRIEACQRNGVLEIVLPKRREPGASRVEVSG